MKNFMLYSLSILFLVQQSQAALGPAKNAIIPDAISQLQQTTIEKQLALLRKEKNDLDVQLAQVRENREARRASLDTLQERLRTAKPGKAAFLNKKIDGTRHIDQTLTETEQVAQQIKTTIDQHIKLLEEYQDPSFRNKDLVPNTFESLKESERHIIDLQTRLAEFEKQKISWADDLALRKKTLATLEEEYKEKQRQQVEVKNERKDQHELSYNEELDILADQKQLLSYKRDLAQLRIKDIDAKLLLTDSQIMVTRERLASAKEAHEKIKRSLKVDDQEVKKARTKLESKKQEYSVLRDRQQDKIRFLTDDLDKLRHKQNEEIAKLAISPGDQALFRDWQKEPRTVTDWKLVSNVGLSAIKESSLNIEKEQQEAKMELEKAKFRSDDMNFAILESWYIMTTGHGISGEQLLAQNIKRYETPKTELLADITTAHDKRTAYINQSQKLNALLDKIKLRITTLKEQETSVFRTKHTDYQAILASLYEAEAQIKKQIDIIPKLIDNYTIILATNQETLKKIEAVLNELNTKSFWKRSTQSIDWRELRSIIPGIEQFIGDYWRSVASYFSLSKLGQSLHGFFSTMTFLFLLLLLVRIMILVIVFFVIRAFLPDIYTYFLALGGGYGTLAALSLLLASFLLFMQEYLISVYVWSAMFVLIKFGFIQDHLIAISFYFLSIPYLLWMTYQLFKYLRDINHRRNYLFMNMAYERRFMLVMQPLAYATIIIFFFREAFLLGDYKASALPAIFLAINFILLQVAVLSLLGKEEILGLIPQTTPLWEWIKEHVRDYYYILWVALTAVIVMSNPYVGYGRQVFYVLSRLIITAMLIPLLLWLHQRIKQASSDFFFYYEDGETMKERFASAKMLYGFFIVALLMLFMVIGIIIAASIWGKQLLFHDFWGWLTYELYFSGEIDETGRRISVNLLSLLKVIAFVFGGVILTYIINHFVLKKVFDPLLIGAGVQNTIFTLTRYVGVVVALFIGMHSVGLDTVATKIAVFLGFVGFAVKEPLSDFFSYFIILVQRPIKIGDLIMVEKDTIGVVRHVTPRSVIVRQRNSVTVIVPNSHITTKTIVNWSYSRSYSSLDDFFITVPYSTDPSYVRQLILKVLDSSTNVLKTPAPLVRLHDFIDNGYQFLIRAFITADKVYDQWDIASEIRLEMVRVLRSHAIEIASPVRLLRIQNEPSREKTESILRRQE
jgi:small-conductance mechanosensitive channel